MGTYTDPRGFIDTARWTGADEDLVIAAASCNQPRIVVSGRLAGGKDTVAEAVMRKLGCVDAVRVSFATALRREVDALIEAVRLHGCENAAQTVATVGGVAIEQGARSAELICAALAADPTVHSYVRTREIRLLLQEWGTDVRRASDDEYWVKQAMREVVTHLAANRPVYVTDARFVNEVDAARRLGFLAVRLEVDLPIRAARLKARDGLDIDPAAENHPSEQQLENYREFDLWVDNSGPLENAVAAVSTAVVRTLAHSTL
jgi:hypothetical protein